MLFNNKEVMHATVSMNLKDIKLSEINQTQDYILYDSIYMKAPEKANF